MLDAEEGGRRWGASFGVVEVVNRNSELLHMLLEQEDRRATARACRNGREENGDEGRDDCDDDEQFDEGETLTLTAAETAGGGRDALRGSTPVMDLTDVVSEIDRLPSWGVGHFGGASTTHGIPFELATRAGKAGVRQIRPLRACSILWDRRQGRICERAMS